MRHRKSVLWWLGGCLVLLFAAGPAFAQTGTVTGTVTQDGTGQPLEGALVQLVGTEHQSLTQNSGRFLLVGVPAGTYTLRAEFLGHSPFEREVTVSAGEAATVNVLLAQEAIALTEIVVTGTADAISKAKVPFEIATLETEDIPVPAVNAASSIQGKVAGAIVVQGSGQPGSAPSILLRGPKSLNAQGRDQEPLYIVDGVILASGTVDLGGLDIQNIEVLKGAAAASLYGSRAANGVIQITTRRGRSVSDQDVRYTVRSTWGKSDLPGSFPILTHHFYALNASGDKFIDGDGSECDFLNCGNPRLAGTNAWDTYAVQTWPGRTYDQVKRFFEGGDWLENYVSASGRSGATNFHVSFGHLKQQGVMLAQDGLERLNFRLNLDQAVQDNMQVSASAYYSRSDIGGDQGPLFDLTRMQAGVDLTACEDDLTQSCLNDPQRIILNSNPTNLESPNPLYELLTEQETQTRGRFLGSMNIRYSPLSWLEFDANASYDRLDREESEYFIKGYRTIEADNTINNGSLFKSDRLNEALNASATATLRFDLAENVRNTTKLRYLYEQQDRLFNSTDGYDFAVAEVPSFDNINTEFLEAGSSTQTIQADGYFLISDFDINDRYYLSALVRNDGSSLFGPDERRAWYYRFAGSWQISQEPWFDLPGFELLKLRYSIGTAGNRPNFSAQYETYDVNGGAVSPENLGNKKLKPEFTTEHEAGIDAVFLNGRAVLGATYAKSTTKDQLLLVPLPRYTGFGHRWQNAGTLENETWEFSLEARLIETRDLSWSARVLFDKTKSTITEMTIPPYTYGVPGQGLGTVFYARPGEEMGNFYGVAYARSCADLPEGVSCDQFAINDDGYLVWVGSGSLADNAWGTSSGLIIGGRPVMWGTPFGGECTDRSTGQRSRFCQVGNTMPDYHAALTSTLSWKGFTLYGLLDAVQGFDIYNQPLQWALFKRNIGMMDQTGVPENQRKPIGYYDALYGVSGLQPSNEFVEDGSFVKLREVSLSYRFGADQLSDVPALRAFDGITLNFVGRNLHTWTDYRGYDPETGSGGGETGSAALARVDGYQYPNFRTWTLGVELNF